MLLLDGTCKPHVFCVLATRYRIHSLGPKYSIQDPNTVYTSQVAAHKKCTCGPVERELELCGSAQSTRRQCLRGSQSSVGKSSPLAGSPADVAASPPGLLDETRRGMQRPYFTVPGTLVHYTKGEWYSGVNRLRLLLSLTLVGS